MISLSIPALFLLLLGSSLAFNCSIPPIYVDMHRREVYGSDDFQWGAFMGVGTPSQNQSLWPSLSSNETSVAGIDFCRNSTLPMCTNSTGGFFDDSLSPSWQEDSSYVSLDIQTPGEDVGFFGYDVLHFFTHYIVTSPAWVHNVSDTPIRVLTSGDQTPGMLGLGPKSSAIQRLYDVGLIASRTVSLFLGTSFQRAGGFWNGSITFGGYDASRFQGKVYEYDMNLQSGNPFQVRVANITLDDPTGLQRNVQLVTDEFDAQISTDQYDFTLPSEVTSAFARAVAADPTVPLNGSLQATKPFNGTMTIALTNGFSVSLPAEVVTNTSGITPVAVSTSNTSSIPVLGGAWLSAVYLMADYETSVFYLAQSVQKEAWIEPRAFCPGDTPEEYEPPHVSSFIRHGLAGALVGAIIGGGFVGFVAFFFIARWKYRRDERKEKKNVRFFDGERGGVGIEEFEIEDGASLVVKWQKADVVGAGEGAQNSSRGTAKHKIKGFWRPMTQAT